MLSAVLLSVKNKYTVEEVRVYYREAMCDNFLTKVASKKSKAYTEKGRELLKQHAEKSEILAAKTLIRGDLPLKTEKR